LLQPCQNPLNNFTSLHSRLVSGAFAICAAGVAQ
jgi:hypothetical protein